MASFNQLPFVKLPRGDDQFVAYSKIDPTGPPATAPRSFVCVAGLGETRYTYRLLAPLLAQAGHTVFMVDLRGMGDSSTGFTSFSVESCTEDIAALVTTIPGSVVMVGSSFSAACIVLLNAPNVVGSMILGPFARDQPGFANKAFAFVAPAMFARPYGVAMWMSYWKTLFTTPSPDAAAYEAYLRANMKESGRLQSLLRLIQASKANAGNHLKDYTLPMIIGMGSADPDFSSPEAEAQFLHDTIRSAVKKVVMYPNVKHYPQIECPAAVARELIEASF